MRYNFKSLKKLSNDELPSIVADLWTHVYSTPYRSGKKRVIHGIAHVVRASILGAAGYNLMYAAGLEGTHDLSDVERAEEIRLIQVALLLHDSGAESDDKDIHDNDNALNVYDYLVNRLNVSPEKAQKIAEATRNKDWRKNKDEIYYKFNIDSSGNAFFQEIKNVKTVSDEIERLRLAIQYGDGIDYLRTRNPFDIAYLQLHQKHKNNILISSATETLLIENRRLCHAFHKQMNGSPKESMDCNGAEAYQFAREQMHTPVSLEVKDHKAPLIEYLYHEGISEKLDIQLITNPTQKTNDAMIDSFYGFNPNQNNAVLYRGIYQPTKFFKRTYDTKDYGKLTHAGYERYKIDRKPGGQSKSRKEEKSLEKEGNPLRSLSFAAPGAKVFTGVGFGILMSDPNHIILNSASKKNAHTGYGKKEKYKMKVEKIMSSEDSEGTLRKDIDLIQKLIKNGGGAQEHTELTGTIKGYDAILYTSDDIGRDSSSADIRLLEALFLRDEVLDETKKQLDIYEFSCINSYMLKKDITEDLIIESSKRSVLHAAKQMALENKTDLNELMSLSSINLLEKFMWKSSIPWYFYYSENLKEKLFSALSSFDQEKNNFLIKFIENFEPSLDTLNESTIDTSMRFLIFSSRESPNQSDKTIILSVLNSLLTYQDHQLSTLDRATALLEISKKSNQYQTLIKKTLSSWICSYEINFIPYSRLSAFISIIIKINIYSEPINQKILLLIKSGIDDYMRGKAANECNIDDISIQDALGHTSDKLPETLKKELEQYFSENMRTFSYYRNNNITTPNGIRKEKNVLPINQIPAEELILEISNNFTNLSELKDHAEKEKIIIKIKDQLLLVARKVDKESDLEQFKTAIKNLKKIDTKFNQYRSMLLLASMEEGNKLSMPFLATNAFTDIYEVTYFAKHLHCENMSIESIEFISKDSKIFASQLEHNLLLRACKSRNLSLTEALLSDNYRDRYVNHHSLHLGERNIFGITHTALDLAIDALINEKDPILKQRWFNIVDDLFKSGAKIEQYKHPRSITGVKNPVHYSRLLHYILSRQSYPLTEENNKDSDDTITDVHSDIREYLHWCFQSYHINGLAAVIRSGDFIKVMDEDCIKRNENISIHAFHLSPLKDIFSGEIFYPPLLPDMLNPDEKKMYEMMAAFFALNLSPLRSGSLFDKNPYYVPSLSDDMKKWLSMYAQREPALAAALIDLQFQICEYHHGLENQSSKNPLSPAAEIALLSNIMESLDLGDSYHPIKAVISDKASQIIYNSNNNIMRNPKILNQLKKVGIIPEASQNEISSITNLDNNNTTLGEAGVFVAQDNNIVHVGFSSPLLKIIFTKFHSYQNEYNVNNETFNMLSIQFNKNFMQNIKSSGQPIDLKALSDLTAPCEIMALYRHCLTSGDILPSDSPGFSFTQRPENMLLTALKKRVLTLAYESGNPQKFFKKNYNFLFTLLNHHRQAGKSFRYWATSEWKRDSTPSTITAILAHTLYDPSSSEKDVNEALETMRHMIGEEKTVLPTVRSRQKM